MSVERDPVTIEEFEARARQILPPMVYEYFVGGAGDEWTIAENRAAFSRWRFRPRVLVGVGERSTATEVLGARLAWPRTSVAVERSPTPTSTRGRNRHREKAARFSAIVHSSPAPPTKYS